jgi:8-oxo-dGTP pyrophosphatase MutT (NUDIX family)
MQRRYDVHIDGKPLVIGDGPPSTLLPDQWLGFRVDVEDELDGALALLAKADVAGVYLFTANGSPLWDLFRQRYVPVQAAGGLVVDEQGRLLAIRRLGTWDLPKGKVDPGEGIPEAALREVREECGILQLELLRPVARTWHTYERKGRQHLKCTDWFLMRASSQEPLVPQQEEDIEEVRWMDAAGVATMRGDTYPSLLPLLDAWEALPRP